MTHDWIIDVLADLKLFARANAMPDLAEHLEDAAMVATRELAVVGAASVHGAKVRKIPGGFGTRSNA
ncbi:MAG: hypothetical protein AAGD04_15150 [Pseudomonadota bacterium]